MHVNLICFPIAWLPWWYCFHYFRGIESQTARLRLWSAMERRFPKKFVKQIKRLKQHQDVQLSRVRKAGKEVQGFMDSACECPPLTNYLILSINTCRLLPRTNLDSCMNHWPKRPMFHTASANMESITPKGFGSRNKVVEDLWLKGWTCCGNSKEWIDL